MAAAKRATQTTGNSQHVQDSPPGPQLSRGTDTGASELRKQNGMGWYIKSWPGKSKAAPVTEVARETITAASTTTSYRSRSSSSLPSPARSIRSSSIGLTKKVGGSTRSLPADTATTRINIASTGSSSTCRMADDRVLNGSVLNSGGGEAKPPPEARAKEADTEEQDAKGELEPTKMGPPPQKSMLQHTTIAPVGWLEWLSRSKNGPAEEPDPNCALSANREDSSPQSHETPDPKAEDDVSKASIYDVRNTESSTADTIQTSQKRSWLQMWRESGTAISVEQTEPISSPQVLPQNAPDTLPSDMSQDVTALSMPETTTSNGAMSVDGQTTTKGWLWSWKKPNSDIPAEGGKLVVIDEPTPEHQVTEEPRATDAVSDGFRSKKSRTKSSRPKEVVPTPQIEAQATNRPNEQENKQPTPILSTRKIQPPPPNQLLPDFQTNFPVEHSPGIVQQLGRLISYGKGSEPSHVSRVKSPPQIKRAVAIGIHGYFPVPLIRTVLGQPTGTSIKFATMAEKAILEWASTNKAAVTVEKIALDGEGHISERIQLLWTLLLKRIEHIREADFVMISCHSQGVPVATMLVSKLIEFGCITAARIGICAMAGVNLGPFPEYRSRWISGSAGELFDFANRESKVSQDYMQALQKVLDFGTRITYVGSIDDQLVSLESSTFSTISHPHIYRAVFVDGRVHAPSFLSHLVGFAMKLRNLGISDHGLIRELSSPLAGSLYTGEGHSRLYDDESVYRLAVKYTLETTHVSKATLQINHLHSSFSSSTPNPYILPFAMRGVLEEEYVRSELVAETSELLQQFDHWKPTTKVLKDVKFRLEGIRSKL
ncbi:hypothetical protein FQN57_007492 [Myotisia sp. PD_48]|nr:hypothetical protein FQN57_007492 [Myotisia sp. PD_48]